MQKFIRTMAILALILMGFSIFLLLFCLPFQRMIAAGIYGYSGEILSMLPIVPWSELIFGLLRTGLAVLLMAICCGKGRSIAPVIVIFLCLMLVLPLFSRITSFTSAILGARYGSLYLAARSAAMQISNFCTIPAAWGQAIAYGVCGMSIVYKRMSRAQEIS